MNNPGDTSEAYEAEAEKSGWYGPETAFGLSWKFVKPGDSILDLGIGTGMGSDPFRKAGLDIHGIDVSSKMLKAAESKGYTNLKLWNLKKTPFPFGDESMDHALCTGVFNFFEDLYPVFAETARIVRAGGVFVFVAGDRKDADPSSFTVGREHTHSDEPVTMYLHSRNQILKWLEKSSLSLKRDMAFTMYMDPERKHSARARAYVAMKHSSGD